MLVSFFFFLKLTLGPTMQKSLARWDCIISDRNVSWYSVGTNNPSRPDGTDSSWPAGNWWQKIKNKNIFKIQIQTHKRFKRTLFIKTKTQSADFQGKSPLSSYKTTLKQQLNGEKQWKKWDGKLNHLSVFLVELRCFPVQCLEVLLNILCVSDC